MSSLCLGVSWPLHCPLVMIVKGWWILFEKDLPLIMFNYFPHLCQCWKCIFIVNFFGFCHIFLAWPVLRFLPYYRVATLSHLKDVWHLTCAYIIWVWFSIWCGTVEWCQDILVAWCEIILKYLMGYFYGQLCRWDNDWYLILVQLTFENQASSGPELQIFENATFLMVIYPAYI